MESKKGYGFISCDPSNLFLKEKKLNGQQYRHFQNDSKEYADFEMFLFEIKIAESELK
jgi:hypothetical protein